MYTYIYYILIFWQFRIMYFGHSLPNSSPSLLPVPLPTQPTTLCPFCFVWITHQVQSLLSIYSWVLSMIDLPGTIHVFKENGLSLSLISHQLPIAHQSLLLPCSVSECWLDGSCLGLMQATTAAMRSWMEWQALSMLLQSSPPLLPAIAVFLSHLLRWSLRVGMNMI